MAEKPPSLTETPELSPARLLRDGLRCLHLSGALFLRAHFSAPFAYESPEEAMVVQMLQPGGRRIIMFHIFTEGRCRIALRRGGEVVEFVAGDIAIFPFADMHRVGDPNLDDPTPITDLLPPMPWASLPVIQFGGGGTPTSMVCGYLFCDDLPFNPVLASLPPLIRVPARGGALAQWVEASVNYAMHASAERPQGDDPLLQRLPELLFMEALCDFARCKPGGDGWLAALVDPVVGRALACLHREPGHAWTVKELARRAATSRSVLDQRFRELLGRAPMGYLTAWRLQLASRQLRTSDATLAEIAEATGYGSEASLSRAFKRLVGVSPSQWRQSSTSDVA